MANIVRDIAVNLGIATDSGGWKAAIGTVDRFNVALQTFRLAAHLAGEALDFALLGPIEQADKFKRLSDQTGLTTDNVQELAFAAEQSNTSVEALTTGVRTLTKQAYAAANGSKEAQAAFSRLGVAFKGADGKARPVNDLLADASDRLSMVENDTERAALAMQLFGRSGLELQPFLAQGSAKIKELRDEAVALGIVMDEGLVRDGARLNDTFNKIRGAVKALGAAAAKGLIPVFQELADGTVAWFKANGAVLRQGITEFFRGVGTAIGNVASFVRNLGSVFFGLLETLAPFKGFLLPLAGIIFAILFPMTAVAALVALLIEDFYVWSQGGKSAIGDLVGSFDNFRDNIEILQTEWNFFKALMLAGLDSVKLGAEILAQTLGGIFGILGEMVKSDNPIEALGLSIEFAIKHWINEFKDFGLAIERTFKEAYESVRASFIAPIQPVLDFFSKGASGGAASPQAAALAAGPTAPSNSLVANQQATVNVQVTNTNASAEDISAATRRGVLQVMEEQNRATFGAFAPAGAQ